jgi:hypothetical protein
MFKNYLGLQMVMFDNGSMVTLEQEANGSKWRGSIFEMERIRFGAFGNRIDSKFCLGFLQNPKTRIQTIFNPS